MSDRLGLKARLEQMRIERDAARALLTGLNDIDDDPAQWLEVDAIQETRDRMAVYALITRHLEPVSALKQLGFAVDRMTRDERAAVADRVFNNARVAELLCEMMRPCTEAADAIVKRLTETAIYGADSQSWKAANFVAKLGGWFQMTARPSRVARPAFLPQPVTPAVVSNERAEPVTDLDALAMFSHEPSPVSIDDPDAVDEDRYAAMTEPINPFPSYRKSARLDQGRS